MDSELEARLKFLAEKYETAAFLADDPSRILRHYKDLRDAELAAFTAALLAFGQRKQFMQKVQALLALADSRGGFYGWIKSGAFAEDFAPPDGDCAKKFYRFYSYGDFRDFFARLKLIIEESGTLGAHLEKLCKSFGGNYLKATAFAFKGCKLVPHGENSAQKRVCMFWRWMVRQGSPVDLGAWTWFSASELLMPLDTHVMQEAVRLGLLPENSKASLKTAVALTEQMRRVWPDDPCKGDFALFGLGVGGNHTF